MPINRQACTINPFSRPASGGVVCKANPSNYGNATTKVINVSNNNWLSDSVVFTVDSAWRYVVHERNTHNGASSIHIDHVRVYGKNTASNLLCGSGGEGYRFGVNGQEKDNEVTGIEGSHNTAEYWMYDTRLGRRWNVDPENSSTPSWSPYKAFNNNPLLYIDPNGDTEFFHNGVWIGTDGKNNGLIANVTNYDIHKSIVKKTKKGMLIKEVEPLSDPYSGIEKREGMVLINSQVLGFAYKGLLKQLGPEGVDGEFGSALFMDLNGDFQEINEMYRKGSSLSLPIEGDISMHGHPTGERYDGTIRADRPSLIKEYKEKSDEYTFKSFKTNIIFGINEDKYKHLGLNEIGEYYSYIEDKRYPAINFYDSNTVPIVTIRDYEAKAMTEMNRGKLGDKFDKKNKKKKNESR